MFAQQNLTADIRALAAVALIGAATLAGAATAHAKPAYDGTWSVLIVTERGTCDRAYRYPIRISNGEVGYAGQADFTVSGRVGSNGAVTVRVSRGSQSASGTGRLSRSDGAGTWSGGDCSGTWTAERR
jgi:hypothetical protein